MSELLGQLLEYGTIGILAATGFYLYLRERKIVADTTKENIRNAREHQVSETRAKVKLTHTLEDLVETVEAIGSNFKNDVSQCQGRVGELIGEVRTFLGEVRIERAKEEGRREITDRIVMPHKGEGHEPR